MGLPLSCMSPKILLSLNRDLCTRFTPMVGVVCSIAIEAFCAALAFFAATQKPGSNFNLQKRLFTKLRKPLRASAFFFVKPSARFQSAANHIIFSRGSSSILSRRAPASTAALASDIPNSPDSERPDTASYTPLLSEIKTP